jgi:hypothetical protein
MAPKTESKMTNEKVETLTFALPILLSEVEEALDHRVNLDDEKRHGQRTTKSASDRREEKADLRSPRPKNRDGKDSSSSLDRNDVESSLERVHPRLGLDLQHLPLCLLAFAFSLLVRLFLSLPRRGSIGIFGRLCFVVGLRLGVEEDSVDILMND